MVRPLALFAVLSLAAGAAAQEDGAPDAASVSGLENKGVPGGSRWRLLKEPLLFLPGQSLNGLGLQSTKGLSARADPRTISRPEDVVPTPFKWGFLPKISFKTGAVPQVGANIFFGKNYTSVVGGFLLSSGVNYSDSLNITWQKPVGGKGFSVSLEALYQSDDKRRFFGIGAHPQTDPRSYFQPGNTAPYGRYQQKVTRVGTVIGLRSPWWLDLFLLSEYQQQIPISFASADHPFDEVFVTSALPGGVDGSRQVYNEAMFNVDTRQFRGMLDPGWGASGYIGPSIGVGSDQSQSLRMGGMVVGYIPVVGRNRLLVPRVSVDTITNLRDEVGVPFMSYPRHLPFFNVNSWLTILRTDNVVINSSLQYQWPVTNNLTMSLLAQSIIVGRSLRTVTLSNSPWEVGFNLEFHSAHQGLGWIFATWGSEGFRAWIEFGVLNKTNDRWRWF